MNTRNVRISELAVACFVFAILDGYDGKYLEFLQATSPVPNLLEPEDRKALLKWLRAWGCRQFTPSQDDTASSEILAWYREYGPRLFSYGKSLCELTEQELDLAVEAYASLKARTASSRQDGTLVSVGPAGAAKTLFAIRPGACPPWDWPIRHELGLDEGPESYRKYLLHVRSILGELDRSCRANGFTLDDLPKRLGRDYSTPAKLIDEYYWVTITRRCRLPALATLRQWVEWEQG